MSDVVAEKIGLKRRIQGWMMFDWATQPFYTLGLTFIFGPYFASVASDTFLNTGMDETSADATAQTIWSWGQAIAGLFVAVIGIIAGAAMGYFGGWIDLIFQRILEIWSSTPQLYVIIIMFAILGRSFWLLVLLTILFGWTALVGVVRAEFLRARNFEYVRAAKALGAVSYTHLTLPTKA